MLLRPSPSMPWLIGQYLLHKVCGIRKRCSYCVFSFEIVVLINFRRQVSDRKTWMSRRWSRSGARNIKMNISHNYSQGLRRFSKAMAILSLHLFDFQNNSPLVKHALHNKEAPSWALSVVQYRPDTKIIIEMSGSSIVTTFVFLENGSVSSSCIHQDEQLRYLGVGLMLGR